MQGKKIVIIDDCRLTLAVAKDMLEADGFEVATSPKRAFYGCRLVVDSTANIRLASLEAPGKFSQFGAGFVDMIDKRPVTA